MLRPSKNIFIIGSSNAKRVFGEKYAGNLLRIRNPELALKSSGYHSIKKFLSGIKVNSIIILHFLINGLYPQRSHCSNVVAPNRNFQYRFK